MKRSNIILIAVLAVVIVFGAGFWAAKVKYAAPGNLSAEQIAPPTPSSTVAAMVNNKTGYVEGPISKISGKHFSLMNFMDVDIDASDAAVTGGKLADLVPGNIVHVYLDKEMSGKSAVATKVEIVPPPPAVGAVAPPAIPAGSLPPSPTSTSSSTKPK